MLHRPGLSHSITGVVTVQLQASGWEECSVAIGTAAVVLGSSAAAPARQSAVPLWGQIEIALSWRMRVSKPTCEWCARNRKARRSLTGPWRAPSIAGACTVVLFGKQASTLGFIIECGSSSFPPSCCWKGQKRLPLFPPPLEELPPFPY
jgi:hypothetical protein